MARILNAINSDKTNHIDLRGKLGVVEKNSLEQELRSRGAILTLFSVFYNDFVSEKLSGKSLEKIEEEIIDALNNYPLIVFVMSDQDEIKYTDDETEISALFTRMEKKSTVVLL